MRTTITFSKKRKSAVFQLLTERVNRLHDETLMLRDYCVQIREVYQSLIDERQNEIMKLLTIVTTIVLPLSLVAGWYGMNFTNMPELDLALWVWIHHSFEYCDYDIKHSIF